jgi:hypothetical protein
VRIRKHPFADVAGVQVVSKTQINIVVPAGAASGVATLNYVGGDSYLSQKQLYLW